MQRNINFIFEANIYNLTASWNSLFINLILSLYSLIYVYMDYRILIIRNVKEPMMYYDSSKFRKNRIRYNWLFKEGKN